MTAHRTLAAVLLALAACGCSEVLVNFSETEVREFEPSDYERVLERWTRDDQLYILDGLDNALTVDATYRSWEFRQAYAERYAYDFRLSEQEKVLLVADQRGELESYHEFYVAAAASRFEWADFASENTPWEIRLVNDQGDVLALLPQDHEPPGVVAVPRPTAVERAYFPYLSVFRRASVLRFPRALPDGRPFLRPGVQSFTLEFSGALGCSVLRWSSAERP